MTSATPGADEGLVDDRRYSVRAIDVEHRAPVAFLNYDRDVVPAIAEMIRDRKALGPTTFGEAVYPVFATFEPTTGRTRVGLSYLRPPIAIDELRAAIGAAS